MLQYKKLVDLTKDTYLYANSMQTAQRRIPIGGDDGKMKHWQELLPEYQLELDNLKKNVAMLKDISKGKYHNVAMAVKPLHPANVTLPHDVKTLKIAKGVRLFSDMDSVVTDFAAELKGMNAYVLNSKQQRDCATKIEFKCEMPVHLLVGYFRDDQMKYAGAPKLEVDATANDYGQAEPMITSAILIDGMPQVNLYKYDFNAGSHTLLLPKGILLVLGYTSVKITQRDAGLSGTDKAIDWLFY